MTNQADRIEIAENCKLNAEVAERIMGWVKRARGDWLWLLPPGHEWIEGSREWDGEPLFPGWRDSSHPVPIPRYADDNNAANEVVVAMAKRGYWLELYCHAEGDKIFWGINFRNIRGGMIAGFSEGTGPTAAPFICRAALQAIPEPPEDE